MGKLCYTFQESISCFHNFGLFFLIELSVGMTTEGIEVRSVGNTRVSYCKLLHYHNLFQKSFLDFCFLDNIDCYDVSMIVIDQAEHVSQSINYIHDHDRYEVISMKLFLCMKKTFIFFASVSRKWFIYLPIIFKGTKSNRL